jgi:hypothetical protein
MTNWTKVLDSIAHGEDVAKRRNPNRLEEGPAGPTSRLIGLVFTSNKSSLLHTCHWRPEDKESEETMVVQPNAVAS